MNKNNLEVSVYNYEWVADMWKDEIDDAFEELEQMILKLDLSDETIQKLIHKLFDSEANLLYEMMFDVVEEEKNHKETPKKPIRANYMYWCPECDANISFDNNYCHGCGQKIDWSDYE